MHETKCFTHLPKFSNKDFQQILSSDFNFQPYSSVTKTSIQNIISGFLRITTKKNFKDLIEI
jgi:hypothetical protein